MEKRHTRLITSTLQRRQRHTQNDADKQLTHLRRNHVFLQKQLTKARRDMATRGASYLAEREVSRLSVKEVLMDNFRRQPPSLNPPRESDNVRVNYKMDTNSFASIGEKMRHQARMKMKSSLIRCDNDCAVSSGSGDVRAVQPITAPGRFAGTRRRGHLTIEGRSAVIKPRPDTPGLPHTNTSTSTSRMSQRHIRSAGYVRATRVRDEGQTRDLHGLFMDDSVDVRQCWAGDPEAISSARRPILTRQERVILDHLSKAASNLHVCSDDRDPPESDRGLPSQFIPPYPVHFKQKATQFGLSSDRTHQSKRDPQRPHSADPAMGYCISSVTSSASPLTRPRQRPQSLKTDVK